MTREGIPVAHQPVQTEESLANGGATRPALALVRHARLSRDGLLT